MELDRTHPGAAGSLREGLEETGDPQPASTGSLKRTLESTNPCESMIECVRRTSGNVKRWSSGKMALRWTAAGMLEAERRFRRIISYRDLAKLAVAIKRELAPTTAPSPTEEAATSSLPDRHTGTAMAKFHDERDILRQRLGELFVAEAVELFQLAPTYCAQLRQRFIELRDDSETARAISQSDRQLELWAELADLSVRYSRRSLSRRPSFRPARRGRGALGRTPVLIADRIYQRIYQRDLPADLSASGEPGDRNALFA